MIDLDRCRAVNIFIIAPIEFRTSELHKKSIKFHDKVEIVRKFYEAALIDRYF